MGPFGESLLAFYVDNRDTILTSIFSVVQPKP